MQRIFLRDKLPIYFNSDQWSNDIDICTIFIIIIHLLNKNENQQNLNALLKS